MSKIANFRVDPKLAELLSEIYRSNEEATKELIEGAIEGATKGVKDKLAKLND